MSETIRLDGQTVTDAYADWIKSEFSVGSAQRQEFGQFAFGVSAGTIGVIFTVAEFAKRTDLNAYGIVGVACLFLSTLSALVMAIPRELVATGGIDIVALHKSELASFRRSAYRWFAVWLVGATLGVTDLLLH